MIFDDSVLDQIRSDRLLLASSTLFPEATLSDTYLRNKLKAASADVSRRLRVFLEPTQVFAGDPTPDELSAVPEGMPYVVEPAYDYNPELWMADRWGLITVRKRPIIEMQNLVFVFPMPIGSPYIVPTDWLRTDRKYGNVQVVPTGASISSTLSIFLMQVIGGGRTVPQMVHMRYTSGLTNIENDYPDLMDVILKMTVLKIVQDAFLPQSSSVSVDGLSQSLSRDVDKYQDSIDKALGVLMDAIHGVRCAVF